MNTLLKSAGGITQVFGRFQTAVKSADLSGGKDRCGQCGEFVRQILILNQESTEKAIRVLVNSAGGEISSGLMIYDAIQGSRHRSSSTASDCVQHGGRDRCVRIAWKIYPAAWGDDDP